MFLNQVAYVVDGQSKTPASLKEPVLIPAGGFLEVVWRYAVYVAGVSVELQPTTSWQAFFRDVEGDWKPVTGFPVRTDAIRIKPNNPCLASVKVTLGASELSVSPSEVVLSEVSGEVEVTVSLQREGLVVGWIEGPGWHVAVRAKRFIPMAEMVREGWIRMNEEYLALSQDPAPRLPFEVKGDWYAYGPVEVFGNALSVQHNAPSAFLVSPETGAIPIARGYNLLPVPISVAWILTSQPAEVFVYLPPYRWARTTGVWKDGFLVADDVLKAIVVFDTSDILNYSLLVAKGG